MANNTLYPFNGNEPIFNEKKEETNLSDSDQLQQIYYPPPPMMSESSNVSNDILQDELNKQMDKIYLQTPKSSSSPSFQAYSSIVLISPEKKLPSNNLPITPNINSSPTFEVNSGQIVNMSNFDTPYQAKSFSNSHLESVEDVFEESPTGLGFSNINFSSENIQIPQISNSKNTQQNAELMERSFQNYNGSSMAPIGGLNGNKTNSVKTSAASNLENQNHLIVDTSAVTNSFDQSFNYENSYTQGDMSIIDFFCEDAFEPSNIENNGSSSDEHGRITELGNTLEENETGNSTQGGDVFGISLSEFDKNLKKNKKKLSSATKLAPKKILKKSISFNGNISNANSNFAAPISQIGPFTKVDQSFSFNDCSNTFALNLQNDYSFIIENNNLQNKMKKRSNSKGERPILRHSSTFGNFDSPSISNRNSPKVLKNMKSGMGMFQIDFNTRVL